MTAPASKWSDDMIEEMLNRMGEGETLTSIASDARMPSVPTMWRWEESGDELAERITRARSMGYTGRAEKIVEKVKTAEDAQLARLEFDAERWFLGKMQPKKFGDKIDVTSGGDKLATEIDPTARAVWLNAWANQVRGQAGEPSDDAG